MTFIRNSIITPDGTVLISKSRYDYVTHTDANGKEYGIDGGTVDPKMKTASEGYINNCVTTDDDHELIREVYSWGTYGKNGKDNFEKILLKDLETEHIEAILDTQKRINDDIRNMFKTELKLRKDQNDK